MWHDAPRRDALHSRQYNNSNSIAFVWGQQEVMALSSTEIRRLTHALLSPETALAAMESLRGCDNIAAIEGLVELIYRPHSAKVAIAAITTLENGAHPLVLDALAHALTSAHSSVRLAAVQALHARSTHHAHDAVHHLLRHDESWLVRRAALRLLAERPEPTRWLILDAADDPHWRVRHALTRVLLEWSDDEVRRCKILDALRATDSPRSEGVLAYLRYRWTGQITEVLVPALRFPFPHLWDWDVAVLQRNFDRLSEAGRCWAMDAMPILLGHAEERIRNIAVETLRAHGNPRDIAEAIRLLDDLRIGAGEAVHRVLDALHLDRKEAIAHWIFAMAEPSPAQRNWALAQIGTAVPIEEVPPHVKTWQIVAASCQLASSAIAGKLAACRYDGHPLARGAALTPERAAELVRDPAQETSWHVLAEAARLAKVPFWNLEPQEPLQPPKRAAEAIVPLTLNRPAPPLARLLGPEPLTVCPLGISGHYGLPVEGFVRAFETGVNLMFWEPNYQTMTTFYRRLRPDDQRSIHLIAGTFEADGQRIQRDVERVLRMLQIERISIFLLFWVQTWNRLGPDVREVLQRMKAEGKIATFGLSTHNRVLAIEAMEAGWNPVMVRHSAAHRGAEERIFPRAAELGTGLITFNNTCYSRLLQEHRGLKPPSAADCYRYALSMPAVRACLSAPSTMEYLEENLSVLRDPELPEERRRTMLQFGAALYDEETTFRKLVRSL